MVFNYSKDIDYHTQINNRRLPLSTCNTTSMIMALKQAGVILHFPPDMQPEDYLTAFLTTPEAYRKMKELAPWFFSQETGKALHPPNEVHVMLEWAVNTLLQRKADRFSEKVPVETIVEHLKNGGGVVLTGEFRLIKKKLGHIVSLAGFITDDSEKITDYIIDDPYGNFRTDYTDHRGNDTIMSQDEFTTTFKPVGNEKIKWAHLVG